MTLATEASGPIQAKTTWTLLLYLSSADEGCRGGETVFYKHDREVASESVVVAPDTGMLLLHKHGDDCLLVRLLFHIFYDLSPRQTIHTSFILASSHP